MKIILKNDSNKAEIWKTKKKKPTKKYLKKNCK